MPDIEPTIKDTPEQEKELFSWSGPSRPFKRRNRDFYVTLIAMASLVGLILLFIDGFMPVLVIVSVVFLYYVLSTVEPENLDYKITNKGIQVGSIKTPWNQMGRFWFTKRFNSDLLVIETSRFPGRMEVVMNPQLKEKIAKTLSQYLLHEEVPASFLDKSANWVTKRLPISQSS